MNVLRQSYSRLDIKRSENGPFNDSIFYIVQMANVYHEYFKRRKCLSPR